MTSGGEQGRSNSDRCGGLAKGVICASMVEPSHSDICRASELKRRGAPPRHARLASLHAGTARKRSLLALRYRRSRPDGGHASQCVDPWGGPHRDRNFDSDRGVDLVYWLGHPFSRVGIAMNAFVLSG